MWQGPCDRATPARRLPGVVTSNEPIELGASLRALRRRADLSQRELAQRAGVPASTVARIESGSAQDPKFRTVERLVTAAGGAVAVGLAGTAASPVQPDEDTEELRDEAGRHYPAHLDVRQVAEAKDWWGAWWADWYNLPRDRWPREAPDYTFDPDAGVHRARVLIDERQLPYQFFLACGFLDRGPRPPWLVLPAPARLSGLPEGGRGGGEGGERLADPPGRPVSWTHQVRDRA